VNTDINFQVLNLSDLSVDKLDFIRKLNFTDSANMPSVLSL
jgi:hypothetical protein